MADDPDPERFGSGTDPIMFRDFGLEKPACPILALGNQAIADIISFSSEECQVFVGFIQDEIRF